jgi:ATP-dependent protease ClpP protease subunit
LLAFLNTCAAERVAEPTVYLYSCGGDSGSMFAMLDAMERYPAGKVSLIATGSIASAAFDMFFSYRGPRGILPLTTGVYHQSERTYAYRENGSLVYREDMDKQRHAKEHELGFTKNMMTMCGFSSENITRILNGESVFFNTSEMLAMLRASTAALPASMAGRRSK